MSNCKSIRRSPVKSPGFTLIEMTLTITVMGIIAAIGAQILGSGITSYTKTETAVSALSKAGFAAERLKREIRAVAYTGSNYNVLTMSSTRFQFVNTNASATTVDLQVTLPNLTLAYSSPNVSATLMNGLTACAFSYYQKDGQTGATTAANLVYVEINFTINDGSANYSRRVRVALREKP